MTKDATDSVVGLQHEIERQQNIRRRKPKRNEVLKAADRNNLLATGTALDNPSSFPLRKIEASTFGMALSRAS